MTDKKDQLLPHDADGIRESDNDLPKWWLYIFYVSIVYSLGYMIYYHFGGPGEGVFAQYETEQEQFALTHPVSTQKVSFEPSQLNALSKAPSDLAKGAAIFKERCVSCHAPDGGGGIGPNLTDDYWIHGGKIEQIAKTIDEGVLSKGMVAGDKLLADKK
jgi:cytochrome c oxidase cbb3-type subunit 3